MVFNLFIKEKYKNEMEQLKVCAESRDVSYSSAICKAVKFYMDNHDRLRPDDRDIWDKFIVDSSKDELLKLSTFICEMNERIIKKCQK